MNYPAGIGSYFEDLANWERAHEYAESTITYEYGSGDLYEIEDVIFNEKEALRLINLEDDTLDNYRIDREEMINELAREYQ